MSTVKYGFIGTGNMGAALARAVTKAVGSSDVILSDKNTAKAEVLANELKCSFGEISAVASSAKFIFLGVKPQVMREALESIKPILEKRADRFVLISMAAGLSISSITEMAGKNYPIIRIMPNTPVSVGKGMILYSVSKEVFIDEIGEFCKGLEKAGRLDKLNESLMDAASALSGCGPAFVYMFAQSLADGAVECGLPRDKAILYASQTLSGAAELLLVSGKHAEVLKDEVCSPGGSTISGVHALEENSFRGVVMDAVKSSFNRTKELGK